MVAKFYEHKRKNNDKNNEDIDSFSFMLQCNNSWGRPFLLSCLRGNNVNVLQKSPVKYVAKYVCEKEKKSSA